VKDNSLKIIYAGTPEFAKITLQALIDSSHEIVAVYTQPDKPAGRGLQLSFSPVKELALKNSLPLYQPASLKNKEEQTRLINFHADVMVVAAYGMLLPPPVLTCTKYGCINIHPSLLPRWRGAAPIQRTIYAGDQMSGVTIMQMDEGLDTGPILLQKSFTLEGNETAQLLHDKLALLGAQGLLQTLDQITKGNLHPQPQDDTLKTYARKITKEEALINWQRSAEELDREIRAFNPWPVAFTLWKDQKIRIWEARVLPELSLSVAGTIVQASQDGIDIATGKGTLRILKLQLPGGKPISAREFYNARFAELTSGIPFK